MRLDEAEKLARAIRPCDEDQRPYNPSGIGMSPYHAAQVRDLCDHILSGDHKREIENAAFERAAKLIEEPIAGLEAQHESWRESLGQGCAQPGR